jgi:hypothetical protein
MVDAKRNAQKGGGANNEDIPSPQIEVKKTPD